MTRRAHTDDLFEIFPDLPRMRHRTPEEQMAQVRRHVTATRERASRNIEQREATARVRATRSARRRR
jgi:hypothetical protein